MQPRWEDLSKLGAKGTVFVFLGGTGEADLWLTEGPRAILFCQYEDFDDYVAYQPARAIYARIKGLAERSEKDTLNTFKSHPPEACVWSTGSAESEDNHDPIGIARYLAVFAPYIFTEEERADLLGGQTNPQGEME
jgi:hypothetical protein